MWFGGDLVAGGGWVPLWGWSEGRTVSGGWAVGEGPPEGKRVGEVSPGVSGDVGRDSPYEGGGALGGRVGVSRLGLGGLGGSSRLACWSEFLREWGERWVVPPPLMVVGPLGLRWFRKVLVLVGLDSPELGGVSFPYLEERLGGGSLSETWWGGRGWGFE